MAKKSNKKNGLSKKQKKILKKKYKKFVKQHQNRQSYVEYPEANYSFDDMPHNPQRILHAVFAEKCKAVEDTVGKLELCDSGVNLIEYISGMTGKILVINLRARDILNSEFGIKLSTDGIHGVTVNVSAPNCFNANETMNALKPDIKGCSAQLTALKPLHNILNNLADFIDFRHPFVGSIESGNETYNIVGYSLNELVNTMIFSIMSLRSDDIQFLNNAIAQDDYCRDCINENFVLTKAAYTANVTPHPFHLSCYDEKPVITEITAEFSFPDDDTDFTIQCTDCEFGDCCHESDECSCCEHADEDSYDLVAPGEVYDDGDDDDFDDSNCLTKVSGESDADDEIVAFISDKNCLSAEGDYVHVGQIFAEKVVGDFEILSIDIPTESTKLEIRKCAFDNWIISRFKKDAIIIDSKTVFYPIITDSGVIKHNHISLSADEVDIVRDIINDIEPGKYFTSEDYPETQEKINTLLTMLQKDCPDVDFKAHEITLVEDRVKYDDAHALNCIDVALADTPEE